MQVQHVLEILVLCSYCVTQRCMFLISFPINHTCVYTSHCWNSMDVRPRLGSVQYPVEVLCHQIIVDCLHYKQFEKD